jgi:hypothetical protein
MVRPFQNAQIIAFWFSEWKVMSVWKNSFGQFLIKIGSTSKNYFSKTKNLAYPKFQPWIFNISKRFPAKFKKKSKMTHILIFGLNIEEKKLTTDHPVNFLSQKFFDRFFSNFTW